MFRTIITTRRFATLLLLITGLLCCCSEARIWATSGRELGDGREPEEADTRPEISAQVADLKQQLEKGLRARRPEEFAFIDRVVGMVANDTLPLDLVKSTFLWARKKAVSTRYPFPYFERALRLRAAKQGIRIP